MSACVHACLCQALTKCAKRLQRAMLSHACTGPEAVVLPCLATSR